MGDRTGIEWTDATWNPVRGCSRVSEGCRHCYAETVAARFSGPGQAYAGLVDRHGRWNGKTVLVGRHLEDPLRWRRPRRIFVNSMSDLFHESIPIPWILQIFEIMARAPRHTFQVLTKRPQRMLELLHFSPRLDPTWPAEHHRLTMTQPLPNVWLGISCENQAAADERIPALLQTPAAVRFISAEPLLGPIDLAGYLHRPDGVTWYPIECRHGVDHCPTCDANPARGLDWVIAGGESGPGARPMSPTWAQGLRDQCLHYGVPFFFKQWGGRTPKAGGRELDGRVWNAMPIGAAA